MIGGRLGFPAGTGGGPKRPPAVIPLPPRDAGIRRERGGMGIS